MRQNSGVSIRVWVASLLVTGVASWLPAVAQRPASPIAHEIHVEGSCRILLAPGDPSAGKKKLKMESDSSICHMEGIHSSEHIEETIVGNELRRSHVKVEEQEYVLRNISADPLVFVVEHPVGSGWQIDSDPQPVQLVSIPGGKPKSSPAPMAVFRVNATPGEVVRLHVGARHTTALKPKILKTSPVAVSG